MKSVAIVTTTRAEYSLLFPVIKELRKMENSNFVVDLIVTGTHLYSSYGNTVDEIAERIDYKILIPVSTGNELDISKNQADTLVKFTDFFISHKYNAVVLLGDRYETLSIAIAAGNTRTPIFHLCGGDTTEGAIDEWIRHSITKMSYLHFVTNEISKKRVIQLGESPDRVFNFGSTSVDNIVNCAFLSKEEALASINISPCQYALCTYHPVTMEGGSVDYQISELLDAVKYFTEINFIITKSNADKGGERINELLDIAGESIGNVYVFSSLGMTRYLSLMKNAMFVIGNSSSGIIEAPTFHIPSINIGDRQRGRIQAKSVINCKPYKSDIISAIRKAVDKDFVSVCKNSSSPYGGGTAGIEIAKKIFEVISLDNIDLKKVFYNY